MTGHERMFRAAHAYKLDDPERRRWLPVVDVLDRLAVRPGMMIADVGSGTGYFALPLAGAVGPFGRVFAVDAQPEMLALLRGRVEDLPISLVHGTADRTTLPDASVDLVLLANVWHEIDEPTAVLAETARILRPGGRIAILDWRKDVEQPPGPPLAHRVSATDTAALLRSAGWAVALPETVGVYSHLVLATQE
ncbi:MAG: methyltransferase domain-containing protein [Vicinamibacteria bacterium]